MQNDVYECYDEVEPRSMPRQASKFDFRPVPMVPEVSLIMDKPQQMKTKKFVDTYASPVPESRLNASNGAKYGASESYASWKEKQFPRQSSKISPNRLHQLYNSTQNSSSLQDLRTFKQPAKSCNPLDCKDYNCAALSSGDESPRRYNLSKRSQFTSPNKYKLSHAVSSSEIDRHEMNRHESSAYNNYTSRSRSRNERTSSPQDRRHRLDHMHAIESYDIRQKPRIHRSSSCSNADSYAHRSLPVENHVEHDHHHSKHSRSLQPVHCSPEQTHIHSGCCSANRSASNTETETIKNLLQIITSQNEQIKSLQKQVERLLKLHEQSLKERTHCTCQSNEMAYHHAQTYDQTHHANLPIAHHNMIKDNERCFSDVKLQEEKSKPTILEQKVSIGVMTSFELKVQNNPSLAKDNEIKQMNTQEKILPSIESSRNLIKNLVNDTGEMIRKKPNYFTPTPLENISEGSESHMSSLRHSNLGPDATRQSVDAQDYETQSTNFYKQNSQDNENMQMNLESQKGIRASRNQNFNPDTNLEYQVEEPRYTKTNTNPQEIRQTYEYNNQYEYVLPSPFENARSSPYENARSSPYENARSSPFENARSSPFENARSSPRNGFKEKKTDEFNAEPLMADITKMKNVRRDKLADECLSLSSSELDVGDLSPPSPEPSIHLDMQEYSSEGGSLPPQQAKVGWTLYNNVLDQVNQILQNTTDDDSPEQEAPHRMRNNERNEYDNNVIMDTVKAATLEQLTKLGISFSDNVDKREPNYNKKVMFDAYYTRQGPETHMAATSGSFETNTSMHMKALAMKYLNDEQLADIATQKPRPSGLKQVPNNVQNTNMSFATMHYLQRYHLLPGTNCSPKREVRRDDQRGPGAVMNERLAVRTVERREPSPHRYQPFAGTSKGSCPSKILDISTLKQQPKLL